jgi:hypothetical protein
VLKELARCFSVGGVGGVSRGGGEFRSQITPGDASGFC